MDKGDYNRLEDKLTKQDEKLDKQMVILTSIQLDINKKMNVLQIAHEKLKYGSMTIGALVLMLVSIEFPKLIKFLKGIL